MEIIGTVYKILPTEEVTLGDGTTRKKSGFVIMRDGEFAKHVAFELFGDDRLALLNGLNVGMPVKVNFLPVSFMGKNGGYYTTLRCTNVFPLVAAAPTNPSSVTSNMAEQNNEVWNPTGISMQQNQHLTEMQPDEQLPFENDLPFF